VIVALGQINPTIGDFDGNGKDDIVWEHADGSWAIWGGGSYTINEKTSFNVQASYDDGKTFGLAANIAYDVVPGFTVTAEVDYFNKATSDWHGESDGVGGILRFQRSF